MIRFLGLAAVSAAILSMAVSNIDSIFAGVAFLALGVTGFGLIVAVCNELRRET